MPALVGFVVLLLAVAFAFPAFAAGYSLDIELLRPNFSGAPPGIDAPEVERRGALSVGGVIQYQLNPLVLSEGGEEVGAVVANRFSLVGGASVDVSKRLAVRGSLPLAYSFGGEVGALEHDGFGTGDLSAGVRIMGVQSKTISVGGHADLAVPISTPNGYLGEAGLRLLPGISLALTPGNFRAAVDATFTLRGEVQTQQALAMGQELATGLDFSYSLLDGRLVPHAFAVARLGLQSELDSPGSVPIEAMAGAQIGLSNELILDVYGGRGLTEGYGATDARAIVGLVFHRVPADAAPVAVVDVPVYASDLTDEELDKLIEEAPEPEPVASAAPLAQITQKEIIIRDMLQFEVGNDHLVPESIPTLRAVAGLMNDNPDVQTLVIEGHASGEGSFESNYELSVRRALAVFRALVNLDVHPSRLAIRGYGEVVPLVSGDDQKNRRVVFTIAKRLAPGEPNAGWPTEVTLPWNGEPHALPPAKIVVEPAKPPVPPTDPGIDKSRFDENEDDQ